MSSAELVKHHEEPEEFGGYFIINGNERLITAISDPELSFLVIRHICHQIRLGRYLLWFEDFIFEPLLYFNQDQFLSFEKSLEWSEFDKILCHFAVYRLSCDFRSALYLILRLVVHVFL